MIKKGIQNMNDYSSLLTYPCQEKTPDFIIEQSAINKLSSISGSSKEFLKQWRNLPYKP